MNHFGKKQGPSDIRCATLFVFAFFLLWPISLVGAESSSTIDDKVDRLTKEVFELKATNQEIVVENGRIKAIVEQYEGINSSISNYLTMISIILTLLAVALPALNLFVVILPNRKIRKRLKLMEKNIPAKVDENFENYMTRFENRKLDLAIERFVNFDDVNALSNLLFLNSVSISEEQYRLIIEKIKSGIELDGNSSIVILNSLQNVDSGECLNFFRSILENDNNAHLEYAISFFSLTDFGSRLKYLEKVLTGRSDYEKALGILVHKIIDNYIGDGKFRTKTAKDVNIGKQKLNQLLNSEKIVEAFNKDKIHTGRGNPEIMFGDYSLQMYHPYLSETLFYRKHYKQ
jgi:hypothetical protein